MTREEAKELLPIIQAWTEGKEIQYRTLSDKWIDIKENEVLKLISPPSHYRIKPKPKYRPFKSQEECWNEMHNHPDFGWLTRIDTGAYIQIPVVFPYCILFDSEKYNYEKTFKHYTFTDGTPFGIKE